MKWKTFTEWLMKHVRNIVLLVVASAMVIGFALVAAWLMEIGK